MSARRASLRLTLILLRLFLLAAIRAFAAEAFALAAAAQQLHDGQVQLAPRQINLHDPRPHRIADADAHARAAPFDDARALVDIPVIVHQIFVADQPIHEVRPELDEQTEVRDARDDAV